MSEEDFLSWVAANEVRAEWVEGEVIMMAPADLEHQDVGFWLCMLLRLYVERRDLGIAFMDVWTRLREPRPQLRAPDVLFVAKHRAEITKTGKVNGPPDLVIEVVSSDSEARDWREKFLDYQGAGVREYWVIDPASKSAEAYLLSSQGLYQRFEVVDGRISSVVVPGFFVKLDSLWRSPRPSVLDLLPELGIKLG